MYIASAILDLSCITHVHADLLGLGSDPVTEHVINVSTS